MNKLLARQLKRSLGILGPDQLESVLCTLEASANTLPPEASCAVQGLRSFLTQVDDAYIQSERDLGLRARSLEISSEELMQTNRRLAEEAAVQRRAVHTLREMVDRLATGPTTTFAAEPGLLDAPSDVEAVSARLARLVDERAAATQAELQRSEQRFRSLTKLSSDWYWEQDEQLRYTLMSPGITESSGIKPESYIGKTRWELGCGDIPDEVWAEHRADLDARRSFRDFVLPYVNHRGKLHYLSSSGEPIFDANGHFRGYRGVGSDVTDQVTSREALQAAKKLAEDASVAKSQFLANMSHEIRTPMNGVLGMAELLLDADLNETQRRYVQTISKSGEALLTVINDILDFSKIEAGRLELDPIEVDVRELCEEALQLMASRVHEKGLELACLIAPEVPERVRADPGRLRQIMLNLLGNAIKFTERGEVTVSIELAEDMAVGAQLPQCLLRFTVIDSGIGISPQGQERLFQAFRQADGSTTRRFGGTGLGLAISKQLAEMMGGEIGVDSQPGHGSRFWFTVRADIVESVRPTPKRVDLTGVRVLIVEDNATNRTMLLHQVSALGASCDLSADGLAGLEAMLAAHARGCPYHLALIDMKMPRMNGIELICAVRNNAAVRATPLAVLTSLSAAGEAAAARAAGADAYLTKPVRREDLFNTLAKLTGTTSAETHVLVAPNDDAIDCRGAHVLLAEDNSVNQRVARAMLEKAGCRVTIAANGRAAIEELFRQPFDLMLMDCQMPELGGLEATLEIRARQKAGTVRVPIVALTASAMEGDRERCLAAGMDDYLSKPFKRSDLLAVLRRWIDTAPRSQASEVPAALATEPNAPLQPQAAAAVAQNDHSANLSGELPSTPRQTVHASSAGQLMQGSVLLAEDNVINQSVAKAMLKKLGLSIRLANNGAEAVELVRAQDFELVLMDCQMPVMDGYEATRAIRQLPGGRGERLPIVALTANAMLGDEQRCRDAGMDGFLAKPYTLATLRATLAPWLASKHEQAAAVEPSRRAAPPEPAAIDLEVIETLRELDESGGMGLAKELFQSFLETADHSVAQVESAISAGNCKSLGQVAHVLKSSTANMGAQVLSGCYSELEHLGREGKIHEARALFHRVRYEHQRAVSQMRELLTALV